MVKEIFGVQLVDSELIYLPGQTVEGIVRVNTYEDILTEGITVRLEGIATVGLSEHAAQLIFMNGRLVQQRTTGAKYGPNTEIWDHYPVLPVVLPETPAVVADTDGQQGQGQGRQIIEKGIHLFPFTYPLPIYSIPCSLVSPSGRIKYQIKAQMKIIHPEPDPPSLYEKVAGLEIEKYLDLNEKHDTFLPFTYERKILLCCHINYIKFKLTIPHQGFALGQQIPFTATIINKSGHILQVIKIRLVETWLYKGETGDAEWTEKICEALCPPVLPKSTFVWTDTDFELKVPADNHVTHFGGGCSIIDVSHHLNVILELQCTVENGLDDLIPIVIGTVPLQTNGEEDQANHLHAESDLYGSAMTSTMVGVSQKKGKKKKTK